MSLEAFQRRIRYDAHPLAHPDAIIQHADKRFTVLTDRLIRLEWSLTGAFEDRASFAFPNRAAPPPAFTVARHGDTLRITTDALDLCYQVQDGPFTAENLEIRSLQTTTPAFIWQPGMEDPLALHGTCRTLDLLDGPCQLGAGVISRGGWALIDDSRTVLLDDVTGWVAARPQGDGQDWYFFGYGHAYRAALADLQRFSGGAAALPRYALGLWWSRYWPYSANDYRALVTEFRDHAVPLDVLVLDMDWHQPGHWTGYTWNDELFPDPDLLLRWANAQGLHVTLNLHPADGVQASEAAYDRFAATVGHDTTEQRAVPFHVSDPAFMEAYFRLLHHPLEEQGVDFWWIDWQQGEKSELAGLDPLLWLNHTHYQDTQRRGQRPLILSRFGGLGNQRYPLGFSGDTVASWESLRFQPYLTATSANVGYGWWSHDIGGHIGAVAPELYVRWVQWGALSPCLRLHATNDPAAERRPWAFPAPFGAAAQAAIVLRYQLIPYLDAQQQRAAASGVALCHPLYYNFPEHAAAYLARDQYMLGDDLLAAPITVPVDPATGLATYTLWIPPGEWIDWATHETFSGPCWVQRQGAITAMPLLARAGAIIPLDMGQPTSATAATRERLTLRCFPGAGATTLYEDDGVTLAYLQGARGERDAHAMLDAGWHLTLDPTRGAYPDMPPSCQFTIELVSAQPPTAIMVNGQHWADWRYDAAALLLTIRLLPVNPGEHVTVTALGMSAVARNSESHTPIVAMQEYRAPSEARQQVAHAIVAAPSDGTPFAVALTWRHATNASAIAHTQTVTTDAIIPAPFGYDPADGASQWSLEWTSAAGDMRATGTAAGHWLAPSISAWRVLVADEDLPFAALTDRALLWQVARHDLAAMQQTSEWFRVHLPHAGGRADGATHAWLVTEAQAPAVCAAVFAARTLSAARMWVNNALVADWEEPPFTLNALRLAATVAITLRAGTNTIAIQTMPPQGGWWFFEGMVQSPTGMLLPDLTYSA